MWPSSTCTGSPILASQIIAILSNEPVRIISPYALKCNDANSPSCPFKVECIFPISTSHNLAVQSIDPVPTNTPWGSNAIATT